MGKNTKNKKKGNFNIYTFMHKHKKSVIGGITAVLVASMVLGLFSQFAYM